MNTTWALLPFALSVIAPSRGLILAQNAASNYVIRLCADAIPAEKHAASELQRFLREITGAELPIQEGGPLPARAILVGRDSAVERLVPDVNWPQLGAEGLVVRTVGDRLLLAGGRPRGTLYAVYSFLDEELGCRWLAPDASLIPKRPRLVIGPLNRQYVPPLEYRETFSWTGFDGDWAARNFSNGHACRLEERHGGKIIYQGFVHTFYQLLPPQKYFAEHPDWYSERNGKRFFERGQLCLTNPEVVQAVVQGVREWLQKNPQANIVSVSQNDWGGWCECARCKAVDEEEGSHSGTMLRFVNQVAESIEKEFPHVAIDTLAYQYTRKPPRNVRPRHNVIVRLCSIECCFTHPLETCDQNASFRDDIVGWSKICNRLYVWDYVTNFSHYLLPHPNLDVLESNIRFFVRHGVKGIFEQGNYTSPGGEMQELRSYIIARILWNPNYGAERAREEFLQGYYGPAAKPIDEYLRLMHEKVRTEKIHLRCFTQPTAAHITPEVIARAEELFEEAERLVKDDPVLLKRVRTAHLPVQYAGLMRGQEWSQQLAKEGRKVGPFGAGWTGREMAERFLAAAQEAGVRQFREGGPFEQLKERLNAHFLAPPVPVTPPPGTEGMSQKPVLDVQDHQFTLFREGRTTNIRRDETASGGSCAWIAGSTRDMAVQYRIRAGVLPPGKRYRVYAVVKVTKKKEEGEAFTFGIQGAGGRVLSSGSVKAVEASIEWRPYPIGIVDPAEEPTVWVGGAANPEAVPDVFVDRIYFVEEGAASAT